MTCVAAVCAGSHRTYILFLSEVWAQMMETGERPDKTAQVEPAPDFFFLCAEFKGIEKAIKHTI